MSQRALYRKYRSTSFDQVLGQDHIVSTLMNAVKDKKFGHAYLFTGPRGVGKTSIARLLAHQIIGANYKGDTPEHIDIIEIDAASNTGVDDVRELREKAYIGPAQADYKIYIIDEVHMLSKAAFNALLKILEEPPAHIVFILATTEFHKVPATVISRTQRFGFHPISHQLLTDHLLNIAKKESIEIDKDAVEIIAQHGKGSFRDAISLLDQVKNQSSKVSAELVRNTLGQLDEQNLEQITDAVATGSIVNIIDSLSSAKSGGAQSVQIASQLADYWRQLVVNGKPPLEQTETISAIESLIEVPRSIDADIKLEITLIKHAKKASSVTHRPEAAKPLIPKVEPTTLIVDDKAEAKSFDAVTKPQVQSELSESNWTNILSSIKAINNPLYAIVRMCHVDISERKLTMKFGFPFHYNRMQEARNQEILLTAIEQSVGYKPELVLELDQASKDLQTSPDQKKSESVINVLGGEMVSI